MNIGLGGGTDRIRLFVLIDEFHIQTHVPVVHQQSCLVLRSEAFDPEDHSFRTGFKNNIFQQDS
jgi:hypothetical protein